MILFTAVVILLVSLVGLFVLSGVDTTSEPQADVEVAVGSDRVNLSHAGGDAVSVADVSIVFGRDGDGSVSLADATELAGDGDDRFEGGERRQTSHSTSGVLSVTVVHDPTNTVLAREVRDVPA